MTEEAYAFHLAVRQKQRERFVQKPENYKVCEQCSSIVYIRSQVCQVCACYRFDESHDEVVRIAKIIGSNAFPFTAGVVPRY
jgi:hypothetical protein